MTFIDVHTHIGLDQGFHASGWWPYAAMTTDLASQMEASGISRAVCFPFALPSAFCTDAFARNREVKLLPGRVPFDRENDLLIQEIDRLGMAGRMLPFAMFDPAREVDRQLAKLSTLTGKIAGLKTQTTVLQSPISKLLDESRDLMAFAQQHDLPVLFHTSINAKDTWAQAGDCLKVAEANPKVRFNMAHSMRFSLPHLKQAAQMDNVWVDHSAHLIHCFGAVNNMGHVALPDQRVKANYNDPVDVVQAIADILGPCYMWGSDNPFMSWCADGLSGIYTYKAEADVLHALPEPLRNSFGSHAAQAWLGKSKDFPHD